MEELERRLEHPSSEARPLRGGPGPLGAGPGEVPSHSPGTYTPECEEGEFCELRLSRTLQSWVNKGVEVLNPSPPLSVFPLTRSGLRSPRPPWRGRILWQLPFGDPCLRALSC